MQGYSEAQEKVISLVSSSTANFCKFIFIRVILFFIFYLFVNLLIFAVYFFIFNEYIIAKLNTPILTHFLPFLDRIKNIYRVFSHCVYFLNRRS